MLSDMPMMAMIRNLGTMTGLGLFDLEDNVAVAVSKLTNKDMLKKSRIHPMKVSDFFSDFFSLYFNKTV